MKKEEFLQFLLEKGYKAINDDGCVMISVPEISEEVKKDLNGLVKAVGYEGSYGWKKKQ